jgi:hypothetical protein
VSEYEARQALQAVFDRLEGRQQVRRGLLGDSNGTVQSSRSGWAYIRYHENLNELAIVRYLIEDQLPDDTPVVVGRKHPNDPYEQVLGVDWALYAWSPSASNVSQHTTPSIDLSHLAPGKVVPTDPASLLVDVRAFLFVNGDDAVEFGGGTIDLTGNVPGVAGHRLALVYIDLETNSLAAEDGDIVAVGTDADAPSVPTNGLPLGVVDLANGEATIEAGDISQYKAMYLSVGTSDATWAVLYDTVANIEGTSPTRPTIAYATDAPAMWITDESDVLQLVPSLHQAVVHEGDVVTNDGEVVWAI